MSDLLDTIAGYITAIFWTLVALAVFGVWKVGELIWGAFACWLAFVLLVISAVDLARQAGGLLQ